LQLRAAGIAAYGYTGGFPVPTPTLTGAVDRDIVLLNFIVGVGEIAISDARSSVPATAELIRLVRDAFVAGTLSGKAGVTHFHVGPGSGRLAPLRTVLDESELPPRAIYATHINRSEALLDEAIELAGRGAYVDIDTVDRDAAQWIARYLVRGGPPDRLSISSDAHTAGATYQGYHDVFVDAVRRTSLDRIVPMVTTTPAGALGLAAGRISPGLRADCVVLDKDTLEITDAVIQGRAALRDGRMLAETTTPEQRL
jgi:beta-aspartyl-dipeptidase (metallo-type)